MNDFRNARYDEAINAFLELDINPAKVVALYPESVAGRLSVPQDEWIPLFGGPRKISPSDTASSQGSNEDVTATQDSAAVPTTTASTTVAQRPPSPPGSVRGIGMLKSGFDNLISAARKDDDAASIHSKRKEKVDKPQGIFRLFQRTRANLSSL